MSNRDLVPATQASKGKPQKLVGIALQSLARRRRLNTQGSITEATTKNECQPVLCIQVRHGRRCLASIGRCGHKAEICLARRHNLISFALKIAVQPYEALPECMSSTT
jgi:hypothetical protein